MFELLARSGRRARAMRASRRRFSHVGMLTSFSPSHCISPALCCCLHRTMARARKSKSPVRSVPAASKKAPTPSPVPSWQLPRAALFFEPAFGLWCYLLGSSAVMCAAVCAEKFGWPSDAACAAVDTMRPNFFGACLYLAGSIAAVAQFHLGTAAIETKPKID